MRSNPKYGRETYVKEQDMRAVEGMVRCGIDLEGLCSVFHSFPKAEVEKL